MAIETINPTTEKKIRSYPETSETETEKILEKADTAFQEWSRSKWRDRASMMRSAAKLLRANKNEYATLMALEMGKPLAQGVAEAEKCAWVCDYYAEHAEKFLEPQIIETDAAKSYVAFRPIGVILAVMPWNFPFWQVFRHAAPGLMSGNAIVLKHASNVTGCALAIKDIIEKAGFPSGLLNVVVGRSACVSRLIEHPTVKAVTLTGSVPAGKAIASQAGKRLKKTVLELGGSDPYVVLADANLDHAVDTCVKSRLINSGQSCIAAKRFIVVENVRERFEEMFVEAMKAKKFDDPTKRDADLGPLARQDLRADLHDQVQRSVKKGAKLVLGGEIPKRKGWFYPPTVLTNVREGTPAYEEETFGPVASIIGAKDENDAIRIANDSNFGLGAAVFTSKPGHGERIAAEELEAGCCFVNDFVKSDPRLPFGGVKESGYGRELGVFGIHEFVNIKTVYVR